MFKNKNIKTKEIVSNEQPIDTFNAFYNKLTEIVIKIISDNSPIINNEHLLNNNKPLKKRGNNLSYSIGYFSLIDLISVCQLFVPSSKS